MIKLTKVTRDHFENENTEAGFYVSIRFRRGMWDVYISDDANGTYNANTFDAFIDAHTWADDRLYDMQQRRNGFAYDIKWID